MVYRGPIFTAVRFVGDMKGMAVMGGDGIAGGNGEAYGDRSNQKVMEASLQ